MPVEVAFAARRNVPDLVGGKLLVTPRFAVTVVSGMSVPFTITCPKPRSGRVPIPVSPPCLLETRVW